MVRHIIRNIAVVPPICIHQHSYFIMHYFSTNKCMYDLKHFPVTSANIKSDVDRQTAILQLLYRGYG